jgi:hypothetical protein
MRINRVHLLLVVRTQNVGILDEISFARVASLTSLGEILIKDVSSVLMIVIVIKRTGMKVFRNKFIIGLLSSLILH